MEPRKSVQPNAPSDSQDGSRSWCCPRCSYSLSYRTDRCPECGTRLSLLADPRDSFTISPAQLAACLGSASLVCALLVTTLVIASADRLRESWQIEAREAAIESATLRVFEWCKAGADPTTWPTVLFDPQYPPKEALSRAVGRILFNSHLLTGATVLVLIVSAYVMIRVAGYRKLAISLREWTQMKAAVLGVMLALLGIQILWSATVIHQFVLA